MKRKILSLLLRFGMSVTLLVGCGTKDVDATNDKVISSSSVEEDDDKNTDSTNKEDNAVNVTKKLEEEYIERIEAYQEYYEQECDDYEYIVGMRITVNKDGLPFLWLIYAKGEESDNVEVTQLLTYDNKKVEVLAEVRNACAYPLISDETVSAFDKDGLKLYIYNEDEQMFRITELPEDSSSYMQTIMNEAKVYQYYYLVSDNTQEIAYIGKSYDDTGEQSSTTESSSASAVAESVEGAEAATVQIPYVDRQIVGIEESGKKFYYADGSEGSLEQAKEELNVLASAEEGTVKNDIGMAGWFFKDFEAQTMFREMLKNPVYTSEQLITLLVSNDMYYKHSEGNITYSIRDDFNLRNYNLSKSSDSKIRNLVLDYVYEGKFDARYMEEALYDQLDSEPYVTFRGRCSVGGYDWSWDIDDEEYSDNVATFAMDDGTVCQFQIEFNEVGDKIKKITYVSQ